MLPKNATDIRQAKVRHLFLSSAEPTTLKFTVHIFRKLRNPTHIAKIRVSKRSNGESLQADYA